VNDLGSLSLTLALALLGAFMTCVVLTLGIMIWFRRSTVGVNYYGRPIEERRAMKRRMARVARLARPLLHGFLPRVSRPELHEFRFGDVFFPRPSCSRSTVQSALAYEPGKGDLFVATQMKCGTTWMQQICYEILSHGRGNLGDDGHRHMYATSPWIEAFNSVSMEDAPRVGPSETRIVKTHLPASMLPWGPDAKYVYVTRHPVACFQSFVDFTRSLGGPMVRNRAAALQQFCSDRMWWGTWSDHVEGFWRWSETHENVLFVHFEELRADLRGMVIRIAEFLGESLTHDEIDEVVRRSEYGYMKDHEEWFEMSPPTPYSANQTTFVGGASEDRAKANDEEQARILGFCAERLGNGTYPVARFYPDIAEALP